MHRTTMTPMMVATWSETFDSRDDAFVASSLMAMGRGLNYLNTDSQVDTCESVKENR
jgi:hypothetical protein